MHSPEPVRSYTTHRPPGVHFSDSADAPDDPTLTAPYTLAAPPTTPRPPTTSPLPTPPTLPTPRRATEGSGAGRVSDRPDVICVGTSEKL